MSTIKEIFKQLSAYFQPGDHSVRDLPGGAGKWVYIKWQRVQDRLNEVCPEHEFKFEPIQFEWQANEAIVRVSLTIEGVTKQAIASVPIVLESKNGKNMARGSTTDRLHAEAVKKAAECWGVGKYLEDQAKALSFLLKPGHISNLDPETHKELLTMAKQKQRELLKVDPQAFKDAVRQPVQQVQTNDGSQPIKPIVYGKQTVGVSGGRKPITDPQNRMLWGKSKEYGYSSESLKSEMAKLGYNDTREIPFEEFNNVLRHLEAQSPNNF